MENRLTELQSIAFKITYACNLNCVMCGQNKFYAQNNRHTKPLLDFENLKNIIDQVTPYHPQVYIWWGEPLLYPHLRDFIPYIRKKNLDVFLTTNGLLLDKYMDIFVDYRVAEVAVSIDGLRDVHNDIRGADVFDTVINNLRLLKKYKQERHKVMPIVDIHLVIVKENHTQFFPFIQYLEEEKLCRRIRIQFSMYFTQDMCDRYKDYIRDVFPMPVSKDLSCNMYQEDYSQLDLASIERQLELTKAYQNIIYFPEAMAPVPWFKTPTYSNRSECTTCYHRINVEPNGDLIACPNFPETVYGNVREAPLEALFTSPVMEKHRDMPRREMMGICPRCSYQYI